MKEKYKLKDKALKFIVVYSLICLTFIASYTFSRYVDTTSGTYQISVAKFNVKVNGTSVTDGKEFNLILSPNSNTHNDKIAPHTNGYFEIEIDPTGTEVSLEYQFIFNLNNIDADVELKNYTINDGAPNNIVDNTVSGELKLPTVEHGFTESDKIKIKVNWEWTNNEDIVNPTIDNTNISVKSTVRQKIN